VICVGYFSMSLGFTEWTILWLLYIMNYYSKVFYYRYISVSKLKKFQDVRHNIFFLGTNSYMFRQMSEPLVFVRKYKVKFRATMLLG